MADTSLRRLVKERGITFGVLAKETGIPEKTLYATSYGTQKMARDRVDALASYFGVESRELDDIRGIRETCGRTAPEQHIQLPKHVQVAKSGKKGAAPEVTVSHTPEQDELAKLVERHTYAINQILRQVATMKAEIKALKEAR